MKCDRKGNRCRYHTFPGTSYTVVCRCRYNQHGTCTFAREQGNQQLVTA